MAERMTIAEFREHCHADFLAGYQLRPWQEHPADYQDLISIIGERIGLDDSKRTIGALCTWLMSNENNPASCSPEADSSHVSAVVLIGELKDPNAYVASFPNHRRALFLPPPDVIREIISLQLSEGA